MDKNTKLETMYDGDDILTIFDINGGSR